MRIWIDAILSVLLAPACAACTRPLEHPTSGAVCPACWHSILPLTPPVCDVCGDPLATWRTSDAAALQCTRCRRLRRFVDRGRAAGLYDGALRATIHAFKYDGRRSLARPLAILMKTRGADVVAGADCCTPVPLHHARRWARGFNQADDLARHIGLPVVRALRRVRATTPQADLPEARRHANVRQAFAVRRSAGVEGRIVLLIDDVSTTGATLDACAAALKEAGALSVRALTAARVVTGRR